MTQKKFIPSVADIFAYDENENLLFRGITLIDSSFDLKLAMQEVRGGRNAALQYVYYHSPDLSIKISDCQWSLDYLAKTTGSNVTVGNSVYVQEEVVLTSGAGTVIAQPLSQPGDSSVLYGWVTDSAGTVGTVVFTGKNFTYGSTSQTVCVRFYATNSASRSVQINANILPSTVKLIMYAQLSSPDVSSTVLGELQIVVPRASLSGNFSISLKMDTVSTTSIDMKALAYRDPSGSGGCSTVDYFAKVTEIVTSAVWSDDVVGISILGDNIRALTHPATLQLSVRAVTSQGYVFTPPYADLTFASSTGGTATVNSAGLVTTVASGATTISATITAKNTIGSAFVLNVS